MSLIICPWPNWGNLKHIYLYPLYRVQKTDWRMGNEHKSYTLLLTLITLLVNLIIAHKKTTFEQHFPHHFRSEHIFVIELSQLGYAQYNWTQWFFITNQFISDNLLTLKQYHSNILSACQGLRSSAYNQNWCGMANLRRGEGTA